VVVLGAAVMMLCNACGSLPSGPAPIEIQAPSPTMAPPAAPIRIHVVGAVARPGVYTLPSESRLIEAVEAAGGLTTEADPERVNLADFVRDGQQVYIPRLGATPPPSPTPLAALSGLSNSGGLLDINTATSKELEALPGIGEVYAGRIVAYRAAHGPFKAIEEIMQVQGIGPACYEKIQNLIIVR
jgi:competence protein ComEA